MTDEMKVTKAERFPYLKDWQVYALWKYVNENLTGRDVFQFSDLTGADTSELLSIQFITDHFRLWDVTLENPVFHKKSYMKYNSSSSEGLKLGQYVARNKGKKSALALQHILDNKFNIIDLDEVNSLNLTNFGLSEFIEFDKKLSKENKKKVESFLEHYISEFIKDNVEKTDENFLIFEKQAKTTLQSFEFNIKNFGNEFIFNHDARKDYIFGSSPKGHLFIHSIVALEKLGYIKVDKTWVIDDELAPTQKENYWYNLKLKVIKPEYKGIEKTNSENKSNQSPELVIDGNMGYLKFYKQGQKIKIGKTTSRKYRLLDCLIYPLGVAKTTDGIFDSIKISKDALDTDLTDAYVAHSKKQDIIEFTMKELQKIDGLKGKISLEWQQNGRSASLKLVV